MNQLDIQHHGKNIGIAQVSREGLYYRFCCRCSFPEKGIYRLAARCGESKVALGVCLPTENGFGLTTKIPVSRIGEGEITVSVETKEDAGKLIFPVLEDALFPRIQDLDRAVLCSEGIQIKD